MRFAGSRLPDSEPAKPKGRFSLEDEAHCLVEFGVTSASVRIVLRRIRAVKRPDVNYFA